MRRWLGPQSQLAMAWPGPARRQRAALPCAAMAWAPWHVLPESRAQWLLIDMMVVMGTLAVIRHVGCHVGLSLAHWLSFGHVGCHLDTLVVIGHLGCHRHVRCLDKIYKMSTAQIWYYIHPIAIATRGRYVDCHCLLLVADGLLLNLSPGM